MSQAMPVKVNIEGEEYEIFMLNPRASQRLLLKIGKMIGPSIGPLIDGLTSSSANVMEENISGSFFTQMTTTLFDKLDEKTIDEFIDIMAENTMVDGKHLIKGFDLHFMGRVHIMYQWMGACAKAQWEKSFSALLKEIEDRQDSAKSKKAVKDALSPSLNA